MLQQQQSCNQVQDTQSEQFGPTSITKLEVNGITGADIKKLQEAGLHTIEAVAYVPKKLLLSIKGISEQKAEKILVKIIRKKIKFIFLFFYFF